MRFLIVFSLFLLPYLSYGQISFSGKCCLLGTQISSNSGKEVYIGSGVGIGCSSPLTNTFLLNVEIQYIKRGYKFHDVYDPYGSFMKNTKVSFSYLDLPIFLEYRVSDVCFIEGGGYLGCQMDRNLYFEDQKYSERHLGQKEIFDAGLIGGIKLKWQRIFVELQYQHGLTQAFKKVDGFALRGVSLNLGYVLFKR